MTFIFDTVAAMPYSANANPFMNFYNLKSMGEETKNTDFIEKPTL